MIKNLIQIRTSQNVELDGQRILLYLDAGTEECNHDSYNGIDQGTDVVQTQGPGPLYSIQGSKSKTKM